MMGITLSDELHRHLRKEMIINFVINIAANGTIAWFAFAASQHVAMWGEHSFGPDLALTAFFLCWIIGAIFVAVHRSKASKGKMAPLAIAVPDWLPRNSLLMGLLFGVAGLLLFYPLTLGVLWALGLGEIELLAFCIFKGVWAGVLACLVIPPAVIFGLATATGAEPAIS